MESCQIFLFGDQTTKFESDCQQLLHVKHNDTLKSFTNKVAFALREEIGNLPEYQQEWFPHFTTLLDLVDKLGETEGTAVLKFTLLCMTEIGQFIRLFEGSRSYPNAANTRLLGLCTGSFAAAAVSVSRTLAELIPAGVEAVLVAFRTALRSKTFHGEVARNPTQDGWTWSTVASCTEEKAVELLDTFKKSRNLPYSSRPYISAVQPKNVVINGPPAVVADFFEQSALRPFHLPIELPYHASHFFGPTDVEEIVNQHWEPKARAYAPNLPLVSAASGTSIVADNYTDILRKVVADTLCEQLRWDKIIEACPECFFDGTSFERCIIYPLQSNGGSFLSSGLKRNHPNVEIAVDNLVLPSESISCKPTGIFEQSKIAVVGFSGRFPDAASNEELWELLRAGRDVHRTIPEDRFDWKAHYDPDGKVKNTSRIQYGCFINDPGLFDTRFFNMSPREAESTDPAQRLAITTAYEALEMAGLVPNRTPSTQQDRIGVFYGVTSDDWREVNSGQNVDTYFIPGGNRAFIPGRISYFFRFSGPSLSIDTACSSSFAAIQTGCSYLWRGECDTVVAGGANVLTNPDNFAGLDRGHFLSTTGNCNAFDDGASGYCRADAVGTVILKRYEDALADNDPIFGVIAGANTNHCGQTESITRPHEGDQASVFKKIMRTDNTNSLDVSYVEMHGTGTQAGDATEMNSVLSVFVPGRDRMPHHPLHLGSIKANIGHAESASGVSSLIKVMMMMKHNEIPPHCGIKTKINRNYPLDLKDRNVNIAMEPTPWHRQDSITGQRHVFLNNFSAAGGNTAILLHDGPASRGEMNDSDPRTGHLVAVTAKSEKALRGNILALATYLDQNLDVSIPALSYTTTARRMHHNYRFICSGSDTKSIANKLRAKLDDSEIRAIPSKAKAPDVAFVFTGQGTLYTSLGMQLFNNVLQFRADILRFDTIAQQEGFPSFLPLIDGSVTDAEEIVPIVAQLGLVCVQMALHRLWMCWGIKPSSVTGHSLGEYAALFAANVLSATDVIYLVGTRAQMLSQHCTEGSHTMLAMKAAVDEIQPHLKGTSCEVACINQPTSRVVSGPREDIGKLSDKIKSLGHECVELGVPYAFHSGQVDPILKEFESVANNVHYARPSIPYISPLLGRTVADGNTIGASYLTRACRNTVNFQGAIEDAKSTSLISEKTIWVEIGSQPVCAGMIKGILGSQVPAVSSLKKNTDTWKILMHGLETCYLGGLQVNWNEYHRDFHMAQKVLELPKYAWDLKNYWIQYRNNFCLTKGDDPPRVEVPAVLPAPKPEAACISSSAQRVLEENHSSETSNVLVESNAQDSRLISTFQGHKVNGVSLCPSSLYADIAMTVTNYMLKKKDEKSAAMAGINVSSMAVDNPLIAASSKDPQPFHISAQANWATGTVAFKIYSVNAERKKTKHHATCNAVVTENQNWGHDWKRLSSLIRKRISSLKDGLDGGASNKLKQGMVYKLFSSLVDYDASYQGIQEAVLDSKELEATADVKFQIGDEGFYFNPHWIDSLGHIAGFVMNGNDFIASTNKDHVFINHGWEKMRCAVQFNENKSYQVYNNMQFTEGTTYVGDTYILEGQNVVAIFEGVKFQGIPRRILNNVLPPQGGAKPTNAAPAKPVQSQPAQTQSKAANASQKVAAESTPKKKTKPTQDSTSSIGPKILAIISDEAGVEPAELEKPGAEFADFGIDSLLSLNITSQIREQLGVDLPSSIFADCPTFKDLMAQLGDNIPEAPPSPSSTGISTPPDDESGSEQLALDDGYETAATSSSESESVLDAVRRIIAEETGVDLSEITDSAPFAEIGVDSLLALTITGRLSESMDIELPQNVFLENENLNEVGKALGLEVKKEKPSEPKKGRSAESKQPKADSKPIAPAENPAATLSPEWPRATSVLLQGNSKTANKTLWLFPDGSGSATSYATLAPVSSEVAILGLNCPFMKKPEQMECTFEQLSAIFLNEIRRKQPHGPYYFGGWSAGGIQAYDAAQQLARNGEETAKLILIDSPNPIGLENPPQRMYDFFESLDFFGMSGKQAPSWLRPHFNAFLSLLDSYSIQPFKGALDTSIIYARDGIAKHPDDPRPETRPDDPREMLWLLNNRTDFGAAGWASLVGRDNIKVEVLDEVNHFSMVAAGPKAEDLSAFIRRSLE